MSKLKSRLDNISTNVEVIDSFAVDSLSRLATWLAPLVPAAMVYHSMQTHISDVGPGQALVAAASIELLGLQVTANWLTAGELRRHGEQLHMRGYVAMLGAYLVIVLGVVVGLKIAPATFSWLAIVGLSLLTLLSATAFVQRRQLSAMMAPIVAVQDELHRAELRQIKRQARAQAMSRDMEPAHSIDDIERMNSARLRKAEERQEQLIEVLGNSGPMTTGELARVLQVSPGTVRNDLAQFNGQIAGDGRSGWRLAR